MATQSALQYWLTFTRSYTHSHTNSGGSGGHARLVSSSQGEVSCSGTPQHSARRSRRSNQQKAGLLLPVMVIKWCSPTSDSHWRVYNIVQYSITLRNYFNHICPTAYCISESCESYVFMNDLHYIQIELHSINHRLNYPVKDVPRVHRIISYRIHFMNAWVLKYQAHYSCIGQIMEIWK